MTIIEYILKDIKTPGSYVPAGIVIGLAVCLLVNVINRFLISHKSNPNGMENGTIDKKSDRPSKPLCKAISAYHNILIFLIVLYIYVILQHSFFSRPPGSRTSVNFIFLGTWGGSAQSKAYVIENILMFLPYGILLPMLIKRLWHNGWLCIISAMMLSILLEAAQYMTSRGFCQLDDVVMNTIGAVIGWGILYIVRGITGICKPDSS